MSTCGGSPTFSCSSAAASASSSPSTTRRAGTGATGSDEMHPLHAHDDGLQALKEYIIGTNRMILNTETVVFTPYQPLGIPHRGLRVRRLRADRLFAQYLQKRLLHLVRTGRAAAKRTAGVQHDPDPAGRGLRQTRTGRERIFPPFERRHAWSSTATARRGPEIVEFK